MSAEAAAAGLVRFLEETYEAPEVLWAAGLALIDRATEEGREARHGRFRVHPAGQLRRLRRDLAGGLRLCRFGLAALTAALYAYRHYTATAGSSSSTTATPTVGDTGYNGYPPNLAADSGGGSPLPAGDTTTPGDQTAADVGGAAPSIYDPATGGYDTSGYDTSGYDTSGYPFSNVNPGGVDQPSSGAASTSTTGAPSGPGAQDVGGGGGLSWDGQTFRSKAAFVAYLKAHGLSLAGFALRHPAAYATYASLPPGSPSAPTHLAGQKPTRARTTTRKRTVRRGRAEPKRAAPKPRQAARPRTVSRPRSQPQARQEPRPAPRQVRAEPHATPTQVRRAAAVSRPPQRRGRQL